MTSPSDTPELTIAQQARLALRALRSSSQHPAIVGVRAALLEEVEPVEKAAHAAPVTKALNALLAK